MKQTVYIVFRAPPEKYDGTERVIMGVYATEQEAWDAIDDCYAESYETYCEQFPNRGEDYSYDAYVNDHPIEYNYEETILEFDPKED